MGAQGLKMKSTDVEMYKIPRKKKKWKDDDLATSKISPFQGARKVTLSPLTNDCLQAKTH